MRPKSPCYGCDERADLCHSKCSKYLSFRHQLDKYNEAIRKKKDEEGMMNSYKISKMKRR